MGKGMRKGIERTKEISGVSRDVGCLCVKHFSPPLAENFGCESPGAI